MSFKSNLSHSVRDKRNSKRETEMRKTASFERGFTAAELIRNTHSIEKGLSIEEPRLGFGHQKQEEMLSQIETLMKAGDAYDREVCKMALGALEAYLAFHKEKGYSDDFCEKLQKFVEEHKLPDASEYGGILSVRKEELSFDIPAIENFISTRHSIRDFDGTEVDDETIRKALVLAQRAPSACNRQGVRAYVLSAEKSREYAKDLSGIGGFAESAGRFIMITGKRSSYRVNENNQYIVSAAIYAAYLSLTLHLYGLGACVVQRPVVWTSIWEEKRTALGIAEDEQLICLLAVGNLKEEFRVPLSHRLSESDYFRFL